MSVTNPSPPSKIPPAKQFRLKSGLRFVPQREADGWHCIIEDLDAKRYFRVGRREYLIASCFDGRHDPASVVARLAKSNPEQKVVARDVEQTVRWLVQCGLLMAIEPSTDESTKQSIRPASTAPTKTFDPFMMRFSLIDGDRIAKWLKPFLPLVSTPAAVFSCLLIVAGLFTFAAGYSDLVVLGAKLFVPEAAVWWLMAWFIMKLFHELGHALVCMAFGGRIRGGGIGIFYLVPFPYVDTTDMWRLTEGKARIACAAGGMWIEIVIASMAVLICRWTENSTLQYFCISLATLGSITTLAFNANPLSRFDGYYILSDLLNRPNLWTEGIQALKSAWKNGFRTFHPSMGSVYSLPLVVYGGLCLLYRYVMMIAVAWGAWLTYRGLGLMLIGLACYLWFLAPWWRARQMKRLAMSVASPMPSVFSGSALFPLTLIIAGCLSAFGLSRLDSPWQPAAPGYISYAEPLSLRVQSEGVVAEVFKTHNSDIEGGAPILRLENPQLSFQVEELRCEAKIVEERCRVLRAQDRMAEFQAEQARLESALEQLSQAESKLAELTVVSPKSGRLIARELDRLVGQFIKPGQLVATVAGSTSIEVRCSVAQGDYEFYRSQIHKRMRVDVPGTGSIEAVLTEVRPRAQESLENPALAAKYGGPIGVQLISTPDDKNPLKTLKPRFEAKLEIDQQAARAFALGQLCHVSPAEDAFTVANIVGRLSNSLLDWLFPKPTTVTG
jgi:putative peptide zinc metalloprotease protein